MRWVRDRTGRFRWRPWYSKEEIDHICEAAITRFLRTRHSLVTYPVSTDDLTRFIEQEADDLDLYADLTDYGGTGVDVEGMTTFVWGGRPRVQIARTLSLAKGREPRLRTTLAHELGHVLLHNFTGEREMDDLPRVGGDVFTEPTTDMRPTGPMTGMSHVDWMEWQASYACGALLMPLTALQDAISPGRDPTGPQATSAEAEVGRLIDHVQGHFLVSAAAAHTRLRQLGYVPGYRSHP